MTTSVFERLVALLDAEAARYRIVEHEPEGRSDRIALIRGNKPEQAAKAMVMALRRPGAADAYALAILPGPRRVDFAAVAAHFGARKASLAPADAAQTITGCVMGAVPPFTFDAQALPLLCDPSLLEHEELWFNAGRLDRSMAMAAADWTRIAKPQLARIGA
jgi:Ala-tRNA(Pro) deacylase